MTKTCQKLTRLLLCRSRAQQQGNTVPESKDETKALSRAVSDPSLCPDKTAGPAAPAAGQEDVIPQPSKNGERGLEISDEEIEEWRKKAIGKRLIVDGTSAALLNLRKRIDRWQGIVDGRSKFDCIPKQEALVELKRLQWDEYWELKVAPDNDFHADMLPCPSSYPETMVMLVEFPYYKRDGLHASFDLDSNGIITDLRFY